jgi:carbamoyltransferase
MIILGIHDGHNCGVTLARNEEILASVSEERLTRKKNEVGFPKQAIFEVLRLSDLKVEEVDSFVFASEYMHDYDRLENIGSWYRVGISEQKIDKQISKAELDKNFERRQKERKKLLEKHFGVPLDKISFSEHHACHAAAAYYGSHFAYNEQVLVITCDGSGDGLCATVSIAENGKIKRVLETDRAASLGKIYSRVTFALGLKPWEHEYKVMGLAPYAETAYALEIKDILSKYITLSEDGLNFEFASGVETSYLYENLRNDFELKRFDAISGGIQLLTEELLVRWVKNLTEYFGIKKIACGGGVFMNVKANKLVSEIDQVEDMFVFPSCGDESLSFGAAWLHAYRHNANHKKSLPSLPSLYLGAEYSDTEIEKVLTNFNKDFIVERKVNIEMSIAELLAKNEVIARFDGKMEWGARALGNRSILTNPAHWPNVERINAMIKMRDFWMPFAPSMLEEFANELILNPKNIISRHMMFAFDTVSSQVQKISGATHPRDKTARAQVVEQKSNPKYWQVIKYFHELTGVPCVLNTSFNLHGFPLVQSPKDALFVFQNSGLDHLSLGNFLVSKRN